MSGISTVGGGQCPNTCHCKRCTSHSFWSVGEWSSALYFPHPPKSFFVLLFHFNQYPASHRICGIRHINAKHGEIIFLFTEPSPSLLFSGTVEDALFYSSEFFGADGTFLGDVLDCVGAILTPRVTLRGIMQHLVPPLCVLC